MILNPMYLFSIGSKNKEFYKPLKHRNMNIEGIQGTVTITVTDFLALIKQAENNESLDLDLNKLTSELTKDIIQIVSDAVDEVKYGKNLVSVDAVIDFILRSIKDHKIK